MDTNIQMVQADNAPPRTFTFIREDSTVADLTTATKVDFLIIRPDTQAQTNTGTTSCSILAPTTNGQATYVWNTSDLPVAGVYRCLLRITYSDSSKETAVVYVNVESDTK